MENKKSKIFNYLRLKIVHGGVFRYIYKMLYSFYTNIFLGCDIKPHTNIGSNFTIYHGARGTVVSPATIIGNNVSIRQNTAIGAKGFVDSDRSPIIEDNVVIGPHVCIIGAITIGHDSVIGAGAVVVKNVPPFAVVAGNPAKIIKMLNSRLGGGKLQDAAFFDCVA